MRKIISIAAIVLLVSFKSFGQTDKDGIKGTWLTYNKQLKVEFDKLNDGYQAKVVWKSEDADKDIKIGDVIIINLKYNPAEKKYVDGTLMAKGTKVDCQVQRVNEKTIKIIMSKGFLKKEVIWTRINN
jgi:ribosomal protein S8E